MTNDIEAAARALLAAIDRTMFGPGQAVAPYVESLRSALAHDTRGGVKCAKCGEVISTAGCLCGSNTPVTIAPPPATGEAGTRGENEIRAEVIEECAKTCDSVVNDPDTKSLAIQ